MMTTMTAPAVSPAATEERLRRVLWADALVTAGVGLVGLLGPSWYGDPSWVARGVGAGFVLVAVVLAAALGTSDRTDARRLRTTAVVIAESAFAWTVAALLAAVLVDMDSAGREVLVATALGTLAFGLVETRLARRLK
jgi:hypothetical protein